MVRVVDRWIEANHARRLRVVDVIEQQQLHAGGVSREDAEVDALRGGRRPQWGAAAFLEAVAHCLPRSSLAHAATPSGSKPNVEACSTATRAFTWGGRTLSRYSCVCRSKISHDGIDTTRARMPSATSLP